MTRILRLLARYRGRPLLISIAVGLLLLNVGNWGLGRYRTQVEEAESKQALLTRYRTVVRQLPELKRRVERLEREKARVDRHLMTGASEEAISSNMQIMLQKLVLDAGLEPEYIKPIRQGDDQGDRAFKEIAIKVRLAGTINNFRDFLARLYESETFFRIETFSLKPAKKDQLRIFLDLKGYFITSTAAPGQQAQ